MVRALVVSGLIVSVGLSTTGCLMRRAVAARVQRRIAQTREARPINEGETLEIAGLRVSVWRPNQGVAVPAPLVVFSHGFHGSSTQSSFLMQALADHGYLVIAPNHRDAVVPGKDGPASWQPEQAFGKPALWSEATYKDRADDVVRLLQALKADPTWSRAIDWSRVALAGHSLGGYTALGLAGAWPSWKCSEVKAVLALSPYTMPFSEKRTLGSLHVPVMYQGGTLDVGITPFVKNEGGAFDQTSSPAAFVEFKGAGHLAWTDLNARFHNDVVYYSVSFLDKYLKPSGGEDMGRVLSDVSLLRSK